VSDEYVLAGFGQDVGHVLSQKAGAAGHEDSSHFLTLPQAVRRNLGL
jgi:hypothetical protein